MGTAATFPEFVAARSEVRASGARGNYVAEKVGALRLARASPCGANYRAARTDALVGPQSPANRSWRVRCLRTADQPLFELRRRVVGIGCPGEIILARSFCCGKSR